MSSSEVSHVWIQKILPRDILIMFAMVGDYKDYFRKFYYFNLKILVLHTIQYQTGFVKITMYKHCTQLYQSSCKQRSDCKLLMTNLNYLSDRQGTIHCIYTGNIAPLYRRPKQVRTNRYIKGRNLPVLASVHQMRNSCLFSFVISSK